MGMAGGAAPSEPILVPPLGIETRQSSDIIAIDDPELASALRFIRQHACEEISVADVSRAVALSRSTLDRRMQEAIGRSPHSEILRLKLEQVKKRLHETDLSLETIAKRSGFRHSQSLCERFREKLGLTPGQYRLKIRGDEKGE
ncbi:helix-turn-helix domain-containing protein [Planctomicrobium sp. SH661]|uniref:helix-turn-helix domain-containing protein n=1 Tax=Planctomicrobium sp. SH661 TaxID=3448124 RepID=UPI003F5B5AAF